MRRVLDGLNGLIALALPLYALWVWPRLPAEIPAHFGPNGQPDRWTTTSPASWFGLPAVGVVTYLAILGTRVWMVRRPDRINLPGGKKLTDHPEAVRPAVVEHMRLFLAIVGLEVLVIFGLILVGSVRTATGGDGQGMMLPVLAITLLSSPILMIVSFLGLQRATRPGGS